MCTCKGPLIVYSSWFTIYSDDHLRIVPTLVGDKDLGAGQVMSHVVLGLVLEETKHLKQIAMRGGGDS